MNIKYKLPDREDDFYVHVESCYEGTVCGMQLEGSNRNYYDSEQDFIETEAKADCPICVAIIEHCKQVKTSSYKKV